MFGHMYPVDDEPEDLGSPEYRAHHQHEFGRRLLTSIIEDRARRGHFRPFASIPKSLNAADGFRDISYGQFARAIDKCAWWIRSQMSTSDQFEPVIYLGPFDLRYPILAMAAVKTGHVMFFISPRNTLEAQLSLIDRSKVAKIVIPADFTVEVSMKRVLQERPLERFVIPELDYFLIDNYVEPVVFAGSFEEYRMKPWILLHTSGSTGIPKIITIRHGYATTNDAYWHSRNGNELFDRLGNQRLFVMFPPYHMAGIIGCTAMSIYMDSTTILPTVAPVTSQLINDIFVNAQVGFSILPPAVLVDLAKNDEHLESLRGLNGLSFAGGPLLQETGDMVNRYVNIFQIFGATEIFCPPILNKKREYWNYLRFDTEYSGIAFRRVKGSNLYELVIVRNSALSLVQAVFITFPKLDVYHSRDLFSRHPHEPDLWRYEGRLDDVIVLNNAEKVNPLDMEGIITSSPEVAGALVVGQGQFQTALLVEVKTPPVTVQEKERLLHSVWPYVQMANERCAPYGRIDRHLIGFTNPDKPFGRGNKGNIQRQQSVAMYEKEINDLYAHFRARTAPPVSAPKSFENLKETETFLRDCFLRRTRLGDLSPGDDFFTAGMDSLEVANLVRHINACCIGQEIWAKQVYDNPTIEKLAQSLRMPPAPLREDEDDIESWIQMQQMFHDNKVYSRASNTRAQYRRQKLYYLLGVVRMISNKEEDYSARHDKDFLVTMVQPDGGRTAWVQVLVSFLINSVWGLVYSFGAFQAFYESEHLPQYSSTSIAWIGTVQATLLLTGGLYSFALVERGYLKTCLALAAIMIFFSLMMLSVSTQYYQVMLTQGILLGIGCGMVLVPSVSMIRMYFKDRKGLALSLAIAGGSFWGAIYSIIFRHVLRSVGFDWAVRVIAFVELGSLCLALLLARPIYEWQKPSQEWWNNAALKEVPFLCCMIAAFFSFCALMVPFFFAATFAMAKFGTGLDTALSMVAVINTSRFFGVIIPGVISDTSIGGEYPVLVSYIVCAITAFAWVAVHNISGFVVFLIIYGFAAGMVFLLPALVMPYLCRQSLAVFRVRLGMVYGIAGIASLISVPIATTCASASRDGVFGAQLWTGLCMTIAACFFPFTAVSAIKRRKAIDSVKRVKARDMMQDLLREAK